MKLSCENGAMSIYIISTTLILDYVADIKCEDILLHFYV